MEFQNKTVMISGGASGIGFLSGLCFARQGANVVLTDIDPAALEAKVAQIRNEGGKAIGVVVDVRDYGQVKAACDRAVAEFSSIDIVLTCAGGAECRMCHAGSTFWENPIDIYDWSIDVNLKGQIYFAHAAMGQMVKQNNGLFLLFGSITGEEGCGSNIGYASSKSAAMNGLVKSLALAGEGHNVRALCVAPGPVLTRPGMAGMKTMAGRAAEPQEIVDLILYLASEKAVFFNGVSFLMDGGRNLLSNK